MRRLEYGARRLQHYGVGRRTACAAPSHSQPGLGLSAGTGRRQRAVSLASLRLCTCHTARPKLQAA
jgi:hypothetical protein